MGLFMAALRAWNRNKNEKNGMWDDSAGWQRVVREEVIFGAVIIIER